jgi:hypothetical protein
MIFLSKNNQDEYVNMFAQGCGAKTINTTEFDYTANQDPIVLRGILNGVIPRCLQDGRTFYYVDTGYFGNSRFKTWHRIVKNNLQHKDVVSRPADRFQKFNKKFRPWNRQGRTIVVAAPDEKPCKFYGIDLKTWIDQTVATIQQHTDRPIVVRQRAPRRIDRIQNDTLESALKDAFALVTYNSVAATESIFLGIPAFTLAPINAADPVSCQDLTKIETPFYPDADLLHAWACHLAYGQFHVSELRDGSALRYLI